MRAFALQFDLIGSKILRSISKGVSLIGIGLVDTDSRDYAELMEAYRTNNYAYKLGDFVAATLQLSKQFHVVTPMGKVVRRGDFIVQLKHRFESQVGSDYREEPAHVVIGFNYAKIVSRVYGMTQVRRDGKVVDMVEQAELISTWIRTPGGWMRHKVRIRSYAQNFECADEPDTRGTDNRVKYSD